MILGIVGHAQEKFTAVTEEAARGQIRYLLDLHKPEAVVSGRSPMGGVDVWAEEIAKQAGIETRIFPPKVNTWGGEGGYRERNLKIAKESDAVAVVVVKTLPAGFKGMRFHYCYHCKGRNPEHVKSGGCWTAWRAKEREWRII